MTFPVNSTTTITPACKRFAEEVMQHSNVTDKILFAGVFNCRHIHGQTSWSQHSFGNAVDLFAHEGDLQSIARNAVLQGTKATKANQGKIVPVQYVIWRTGHRGIWSPEKGWHDYTGYHPNTHVHCDFRPTRTGTPPCAG